MGALAASYRRNSQTRAWSWQAHNGIKGRSASGVTSSAIATVVLAADFLPMLSDTHTPTGTRPACASSARTRHERLGQPFPALGGARGRPETTARSQVDLHPLNR